MSNSAAARTTSADCSPLIAAGTRVGKYEIVHRIACGGMAEIYLARASGIHGFEKYVVLKRILPQYAANEDFVRMFLKEARVAASLDHPNIAQVHDIGEADGSTFFTMEYLHGEDLRQVMRHVMRTQQQLPLEHALGIAIAAASGLHFAHEKRGPDGRPLGIVHRDISPANVVVTYDGGVKLVDFGIAKLSADPELSQGYALKGKLAYMAPEQLHQEPLDRRTDVFSLGVVLYEITTHTRLFKGRTQVETMKSVLDGLVPPPTTVVSGYPAALERIVLRSLSRRPEDRYQSARELQVDLETFVHEERIRLSPVALAEWMERTFDAKQEVGHSLPKAASDPKPSPEGNSLMATKVTLHEALGPSAPAAGFGPPVVLASLGPASGVRRRWAALVVVLALVVGGGALWTARSRAVADDMSAARSSPVLLVAEQGQVAVEHDAVVQETPEAVTPAAADSRKAAPEVHLLASAPPARAATPKGRRAPSSAGASRGGRFSSTFARRESDIRRCFLAHPGAASPDISLRFDVQRDGHVASVAVQPAAVAAGPLGACLAAVGKSTVFQALPAPVTFRIPLTVETLGKGAR